MPGDSNYDRVRAAYALLKREIKERFPLEQFVAIADGRVIADAAAIPELESRLQALGLDLSDVLVDQAGYEQEPFQDYPGWIMMNAIIEHWMKCLAVIPDNPSQSAVWI